MENTAGQKLCILKWSFPLSSVDQSCPTLCDSMDCNMPGLPVHHQHPELAQTHIHQVSYDIQPSYPRSSPSPPAFNLSQHHDVFQLASSSHQLVKVLEFQLQHHSFQWIQDWFSLGLTDLILLQSKELSRVFSNTTVQKHQFFRVQLPLWFNTHIHTWLLEKP